MRHGLQQRGFERVALACDLRRLRLRRKPVESEGLTDLVGCSGEQPRLGPIRLAAATLAQRPDRAELPATGLDPNPVRLTSAVLAAPTLPWLVDAAPSCRRLIRRPLEDMM